MRDSLTIVTGASSNVKFYQMTQTSRPPILIFSYSCKCILPCLSDVFRSKLQPFRGVKTVRLQIDQLGGSSSSWGRGGVSGTLPKLPQMHSFHLCWEQISAWNGRAGSSVLPVEEVHLKGEVICHIDTITKRIPSNFLFQISCSSMDCTSSVAGPKMPNMVDSCCSQFQTGVCRHLDAFLSYLIF